MMVIVGILGRMFSRMIVARFVVISISISLFVITLETLTNMTSILTHSPGEGYLALLRYAALRLPGIFSVFFVLVLLLSTVLTLVELGYRNEIVPIWAAGASPQQIFLMLVPLGLFMGLALFVLNDRVVPATVRSLSEWGVGEFTAKKLSATRRGALWMRSGRDILRAGKAEPNTTQMEDVIIFRRDRDGLLTEQIHAARALKRGERWILFDVVIYQREPVPPTRLDNMIYAGTLRLASERLRSGDPEEMTLADLDYFVRNAGFGLRPVFVYQVWWHRRLANLLVPLLMIGLCIPLAVQFRRGGIAAPVLLSGVSVGFVFFIFDGISLTVGELGLAPAWLAGWLPAALLLVVTVAFYIRAQILA